MTEIAETDAVQNSIRRTLTIIEQVHGVEMDSEGPILVGGHPLPVVGCLGRAVADLRDAADQLEEMAEPYWAEWRRRDVARRLSRPQG